MGRGRGRPKGRQRRFAHKSWAWMKAHFDPDFADQRRRRAGCLATHVADDLVKRLVDSDTWEKGVDLARATGHKGTAHPELRRLTDLGVLACRFDGRAAWFRFNADSPAASAHWARLYPDKARAAATRLAHKRTHTHLATLAIIDRLGSKDPEAAKELLHKLRRRGKLASN